MKTITTRKFNKATTTDLQDIANGIVAFEQVEFTINFFGTIIETTHDTKILKDGTQIVIGGCGYIQEGYILTN
jgi:hypothetical protein